MNSEQQQMIAAIVKDKRRKLRFTQQELADASSISLRSVQRIENGEVLPRMHTLKALASSLDFSLDILDSPKVQQQDLRQVSLFREVLVFLAVVLVIGLLAMAFVAQSKSFPETDFELLLYCVATLGVLSFILFKLWNKNKLFSLQRNV